MLENFTFSLNYQALKVYLCKKCIGLHGVTVLGIDLAAVIGYLK